jgi:AAA domain, putative AbiEii toxin, Type IV TA system
MDRKNMEHISDFSIQRFRGLRDLKIENLGQVNLFVGNNNSGKTSVLEALSIFCDPFSWRKWYEVASQRELSSQRATLVDRIVWGFPSEANDDSNLSIESSKILLSASGSFPIKHISASYEKFTEVINRTRFTVPSLEENPVLEEREVESEGVKINLAIHTENIQPALFGAINGLQETISFSESRPLPQLTKQRRYILPSQVVNQFSHRTSGLTSQLWSDVVEADLKAETINLLRFFDPAIDDVDIISPLERKTQLSIKHQKLGRAPLFTFGDGLRRVFTLATSIPRAKNGLLLIDELETAIHTKALEKTFDWLVNACISNNVQLFATTHSLEALDAILEVSREHTNLVVYRLQQDAEQTTATRFDKETTLRLREELGMELRY